MGTRCWVDADCWYDCDSNEGPCYAYRDSSGICHSGCGKERSSDALEMNDDEKISFVVSGVSGNFLASLLRNVLSDDILDGLLKSSDDFSFALASASKAEIVNTVKSLS